MAGPEKLSPPRRAFFSSAAKNACCLGGGPRVRYAAPSSAASSTSSWPSSERKEAPRSCRTSTDAPVVVPPCSMVFFPLFLFFHALPVLPPSPALFPRLFSVPSFVRRDRKRTEATTRARGRSLEGAEVPTTGRRNGRATAAIVFFFTLLLPSHLSLSPLDLNPLH